MFIQRYYLNVQKKNLNFYKNLVFSDIDVNVWISSFGNNYSLSVVRITIPFCDDEVFLQFRFGIKNSLSLAAIFFLYAVWISKLQSIY